MRPLTGVRVVDVGQIYQGGYCGLLLSYLGAEVIKVEPPWGENVRTRSEDGKPPQVQYLNANKKGVTLDLKSADGKQAFKDLVAESDVVFENFSTGKMEDLGLGYDALREVAPAIVYAHGSGYGDTGPYADYPAMDLTIQAMSGLMETTGFPDGPPVKAGPAVCDFLGATHMVIGIVSALHQREKTGEGQYVDVGMYDCMLPTLASPVSSIVAEQETPPRTGNRHSGLSIAPYNTYEVKDGYVSIICVAERQWESLVAVIGREDLVGEEGYSSKRERADRIDEIDAIVEEWTRTQTKDEAVETLQSANVPCAPVQTVNEVLEDEQLDSRDMLNYLPNQGEGRDEVPVPGLPIKFSEVDEPEVAQAPLLGEDTEEVFSTIVGYSKNEIDRLLPESATE